MARRLIVFVATLRGVGMESGKTGGLREEIGTAVVDGVTRPIAKDDASHQFQIAVDGYVAFLRFRLAGNMLSLVHTEVPPELRGRGLGESLARAALEYARAHALTVKPYCPYVAAFITRTPEYLSLVDPSFTPLPPPAD